MHRTGATVNLMALPARHVLNMVYFDLVRNATAEDRVDIDNWCTCTVVEANDWAKAQQADGPADRLRLARMAGEVGP